MILGRLEGGRCTRRTLTTDNASQIFILKPIPTYDDHSAFARMISEKTFFSQKNCGSKWPVSMLGATLDFYILNFTALSVVGVLQYSLLPLAL